MGSAAQTDPIAGAVPATGKTTQVTDAAASVADYFPRELARAFMVVPSRWEGGALVVLAANPERTDLAGELAFALGCDVKVERGDPVLVQEQIRRLVGESKPAAAALPSAEPPSTRGPVPGALLQQEGRSAPTDAPAIQLIDRVLERGITERASDIHFEPFEREFRIRYRVDGTLRDVESPSPSLAPPVISRLKVLANLDIAERRSPQDGRIRFRSGGQEVDLRISTLPTQFGESVVLRVLDAAAVSLDLPTLGLGTQVLDSMVEVIHRPSGLLLVTGPTGSGKTTTLYSALQAINLPGLKLLTIEDPIEYEIDGARQVAVNPGAGLTFASALRSFLRHDPDVIMVGEIRDLETAQIGIQAALTGHLVLATMHTNDAPSAATRLVDMGIEPFLLASTVEAILAQRLVRKSCPNCLEDYRPSPSLLDAFGLCGAGATTTPFKRGAGCALCRGTGYRGRMGLFEWLVLDDSLRKLIGSGAPAQVVRDHAIAQGMRTLRQVGARAIVDGKTTLEEVARHL